jgi:hypothetical protein
MRAVEWIDMLNLRAYIRYTQVTIQLGEHTMHIDHIEMQVFGNLGHEI